MQTDLHREQEEKMRSDLRGSLQSVKKKERTRPHSGKTGEGNLEAISCAQERKISTLVLGESKKGKRTGRGFMRPLLYG